MAILTYKHVDDKEDGYVSYWVDENKQSYTQLLMALTRVLPTLIQ